MISMISNFKFVKFKFQILKYSKMLIEKRDVIIILHRAKKWSEEIQVIYIIFYIENGFLSLRLGQSFNCFNNYNIIFNYLSQLKL